MNIILNKENVNKLIFEQHRHLDIRLLNQSDKKLLVEHFLRLDKNDAYLRFNMYISENSMDVYLSHIDWEKHHFIGFFDDNNILRGVSQLSATEEKQIASLGISVEKPYQSKGFGFCLLISSVSYAKDKGYNYIAIEYAARNYRILSWVKRAGFNIKRRGCEMSSIFSTSSIK